MFWLGLLLPIVYVPGWTGAAIPTQWPFLSLVLPFFLWRRVDWTIFHWLFVAFLAYACASLAWVPNAMHSGYNLWICFIWALSFWLGSSLTNLTQLWTGLALGLSISSAVAVAQSLGFEAIPSFSIYPGGLFYNSTLNGTLMAIGIVGLLGERLYWLIPALLPGLYVSHSRGAYLALAVGILVRYVHWVLALGILLALGIVYTITLTVSDHLRVEIWSVALRLLSPFGFGVGGFGEIYIQQSATQLIHPEFVHNDYLQLAVEFGIGAIPLLLILSRAAFTTEPVLLAILAIATFYFPLFCPVLAFIAFVIAGHSLRGVRSLWPMRFHWRSSLLPWRHWRPSLAGPIRRNYLPLQPNGTDS